MSILTRKEIEKALGLPSNDRLIMTPILSPKQIGDASIDVRLGNQFIIFRMHTFGVFEPFKKSPAELRNMQERRIVRFGDKFVLHPRMLALACTLEYISLPSKIACQVEGRSSWARLGLQVATATSVQPGFKGVLTLELSNLGTIPLELYPGVRIAQLLFNEVSTPVRYGKDRKYTYPVGPEFSKIHDDKDGFVFTNASKQETNPTPA